MGSLVSLVTFGTWQTYDLVMHVGPGNIQSFLPYSDVGLLFMHVVKINNAWKSSSTAGWTYIWFLLFYYYYFYYSKCCNSCSFASSVRQWAVSWPNLSASLIQSGISGTVRRAGLVFFCVAGSCCYMWDDFRSSALPVPIGGIELTWEFSRWFTRATVASHIQLLSKSWKSSPHSTGNPCMVAKEKRGEASRWHRKRRMEEYAGKKLSEKQTVVGEILADILNMSWSIMASILGL